MNPESNWIEVGHLRKGKYVSVTDVVYQVSVLLSEKYRLSLVSASDDGEQIRIVYLFLASKPDRRRELWLVLDKTDLTFPTIALLSFSGGRFEREIHDLFGAIPLDHPLPRRLVRHSSWPKRWYPMRKDRDDAVLFGQDEEPFPFLKVEGSGIYEIPVGPIHAGIIEPGHFRFSVIGETIVKLKIRLWFLHKGIERLFEGLEPSAGIALAERVSGDSSVSHTLAYVLAVEDALKIQVPKWVQALRAMLVELERIYNHVADLGALCNDVGFGVINSHALALREELLRINDSLTGHRLLRGAIFVGGIRLLQLPDISKLESISLEVDELCNIALSNAIVKDRFVDTSVLDKDSARDIGCLGPVARASGLSNDARLDHAFYPLDFDPVVFKKGDVFARFMIRWKEIGASVGIIGDIVNSHTESLEYISNFEKISKDSQGEVPLCGLGLVESWRGMIATRIELNHDLVISRVKIVDPSWFNWPALPLALKSTIVPDFPLTNKSFNLSYSGNDL